MTPPMALGIVASSVHLNSDPILALPGLIGYYRAEDIPGADGTALTGWPDASGNNNHAVLIGDSGSAPVVHTNKTPKGGRAVSGFSGTKLLVTPMGIGDLAMKGSTVYGGYPASRALHNAAPGANGWMSSNIPSVGAPEWVELHFRTATVLTSLTLSGGSEGGRWPKDFTIRGSNDDFATYDVLDTRAGITWTPTYAPQNFAFANTTAYKKYRVHITATDGGSYASVANIRPNGGGTPYVVNSGSLYVVMKTLGQGGMPVDATGSGSDNYFPYDAGAVQTYQDFANLTDRPLVTSSVPLDQWNVVDFYANPTHRGFNVAGANQQNQAYPAKDWRDGLVLGGQIGRGVQAEIAAIAVFNQDHSSGAKADIRAALIAKHIA